jgi:tetratricopeptide (TPR) repeat protein
MLGVANIYKQRDQFAQAIDYLTAITKLEENHGEVWALLGMSRGSRLHPLTRAGHCQLMLDNLSEAYNAYQTALYHLQNLRVRHTVCPKSADAIRNRGYGTASAFCTTDMARSSTPRRLSRRSCAWPPTLKRQTKSTSASV